MRLLNVLIIDDEPFVVDWLSNLLESQGALALDIVCAYNAAEAIEKLEKIRIDIMISDIRMPDMDGLQLAQVALRHWKACKVMLLTAHADFQYAHHAISQGIVSYILKTETDANILKELQRVIQLIEQEFNQTQLLEETRRDRDAYHYQLQRYAFFHWLKNDHAPFALGQYPGMLGFKPEPVSSCLLIGQISVADQSGGQADERIFFQIKVAMLRFLREYIEHYAMELDHQQMIWILQPQAEFQSRFILLLRGLLEPVQQFCQETYRLTISFQLSELTGNPADIPLAYQASELLLQSMRASRDGYIYTYSLPEAQEIVRQNEASLPLRSAIYVKQIRDALENDQPGACKAALSRICSGLRSRPSLQDNSALETYYSTALVFLHEINRRKQPAAEMFSYFQPWRHPDWAAACLDLEALSKQLFDLQESDRQQNAKHIIQQVDQYITQHIREDISLTVLSDVVGYNASYLSRFYSEKTGQTISDSIARQKMKLIDQLMRDPACTLNQVAELAGFRSRTYFNNFIKRVTDQSPQKYRDNLAGK